MHRVHEGLGRRRLRRTRLLLVTQWRNVQAQDPIPRRREPCFRRRAFYGWKIPGAGAIRFAKGCRAAPPRKIGLLEPKARVPMVPARLGRGISTTGELPPHSVPRGPAQTCRRPGSTTFEVVVCHRFGRTGALRRPAAQDVPGIHRSEPDPSCRAAWVRPACRSRNGRLRPVDRPAFARRRLADRFRSTDATT